MAGPLTPNAAPGPLERTGPPHAELEIVTKGDVDDDSVRYGGQRIGHLVDGIDEPILLARLKLVLAADPARDRPAGAQVTVDVDGHVLRAEVAGHDLHEAVDLLCSRMRDQLEHARQHREALRRRQPPPARPGVWRHGSVSGSRPDHFDRPIDEREVVRHKSYAASELTRDEAALELEQLDYDFHLFHDVDSRDDALIQRAAEHGYFLQHAHAPVTTGQIDAVSPIIVGPNPAPRLTVAEAIDRLVDGGERFVFFADARTDRGAVLYHRYDGHYGLLTLT